MSDMESVTRLPEDFDGRVRLFPLPDLVVFPHAMQPLHIFESRYCDLLAESLATDRLIAMATLRPGEPAAAGLAAELLSPPAVGPFVCIARIVSHVSTDDGRHNVLLIGARRARLLRELETQRSFRMAEVAPIEDVYPPEGVTTRQGLRRRVLEAFAGVIPPAGDVQRNLHELMAGQMPLGPITDIISFTLQFDYRRKLALLGEGNVDRRAEQLVQTLQQLAAAAAAETPSNEGFPPPFSVN